MLCLAAPHGELGTLTEHRQQPLDGFESRRDLAALESADRRLRRAGAQRELCLGQTVGEAALADQLPGMHSLNIPDLIYEPMTMTGAR